jgi:hypothetical protein
MKRHLLFASLLVFYMLSGTSMASAASKQADFSGTWTLDRGMTSHLPLQLDSYTMVVTQNATQLKVETTVEMKDNSDATDGGNPTGQNGGGSPRRGGGSYPGRTGVSFPGAGGMGLPGSGGYPGGGGYPRGGNGPRSSGDQQSGTRALRTYLPTATYVLNGNETTAEVTGRMPGKATLKAVWKKGGRVLNLSMIQKLDAGDNTVTVETKETWEFSKDGKTLKMERNVKTPRGSDSVKLAFRKGEDSEGRGSKKDPS